MKNYGITFLVGCLLFCGGCTLTKNVTHTYDPQGNVVSTSKEEQKCFANFCPDAEAVQMRDGSGLNLQVGVPSGAGGSLPFVTLQAGGFTNLSSPVDADACSRSGVSTDSAGNQVLAEREVCVGVHE